MESKKKIIGKVPSISEDVHQVVEVLLFYALAVVGQQVLEAKLACELVFYLVLPVHLFLIQHLARLQNRLHVLFQRHEVLCKLLADSHHVGRLG